MSEEVQRRFARWRSEALQWERDARERAERNRQRGDEFLARLHEQSAELQADAAAAAERLRLADVAVEGDQLDCD